MATTLRAPVTGIAPVLEILRNVFGLSPAQAGLLTTLPLLAFGVVSPFSVIFAREYGLERSLFGALIVMTAGALLRAAGAEWSLFLGTALIGIGIAVGNVLLPSLVKRDFAHKVAAITGICAITMGSAAGLASAAAFPLANAFSWRAALIAPIAFPLISLAFWSSQLRGHTPPARDTATPPHGGRVWHSALAWQVTLFMGINSLLYYVLVAWLPAILTANGLSATTSGSLHGIMQLASAAPGLLLTPVVSRMKDQRLSAATMAALMALALLGFRFMPGLATLWAVCFGFGSGGGILLALMFMSLRASNIQQATALSGMAQCVGYLLAACGPTLAGALHDRTGGWTSTLWIGVILALVMACLGLLAGRSRTIGVKHASASQPASY